MKKHHSDIKQYQLDSAFFKVHKEAGWSSSFGLDNSSELLEGGFGLYSTANLKASIEPIKVQHYRIGLVRSGTATMNIGIEAYHPTRDSLVFGFPGQLFSLYDKSDDFFAYYMLFKEEFIPESLLLKENREPYPFLSYTGVQSFRLSPEEAEEVEALILKVDSEIKTQKSDARRAIQLYLQLILLQANRSYEQQRLVEQETAHSGNALYRRFLKLVSRHFLSLRKVSDYANLLHVSTGHLNRTIKSQSAKTANELIDAMLLTEAKAYLLHTDLSNAEIAYRLEFSDPSHFNKFFKRQASCTPLQYRGRS